MLTCKHASQLISQSLDRRLSWWERINLRLHLTLCDVCTRFQSQLQQLRIAVKRLSKGIEQDETIKLPADAKQRISNALESRHSG